MSGDNLGTISHPEIFDANPRLDPRVRMLKIEAEGDPWKGVVKPKIRIMGSWLDRAGFSPGNRVQVTCVAPGVIELRFHDASTVSETKRTLSEKP